MAERRLEDLLDERDLRLEDVIRKSFRTCIEEMWGARQEAEQASQEAERARRECARLHVALRTEQTRVATLLDESRFGRPELGTETHTRHREIFRKVRALTRTVERVAARWAAESPELSTSRRAADVYGQLFYPEIHPDAVAAEWRRLTRDLAGAMTLHERAEAIRADMKRAGGQQQWLWEHRLVGADLDPDLADVWWNDPPDGTVSHVVLPAYAVDGLLIGRPLVATRSLEGVDCDES